MDRQQIALEILRRADDVGLPAEAGKTESLDRLAAYAQLVEHGNLTGVVTRDRSHRHNNVLGAKITPKGREFLHQMTKESEPKRTGRLAKWLRF